MGAGLGAASSFAHNGDVLEGAASGALGAVLSESVMKLMESDIQTAIKEAHANCHTKEERLEFLNEYMRKKTDMSVLLSTCVATALDLDPSMSEFTARNALENNCLLQVAGAALTIWEMYDTYQETGDVGEVLKTGAIGLGASLVGGKALQAGAKLLKGGAKTSLSKLAGTQGKKHLLPKPKTVKHHIFNKFRGQSEKSQKYREFFKKHGVEVDSYSVQITESMHKYKIHQARNNWTTRWKNWIDQNPNATTKEVYQFAGKLMDEYNISHVPIKPYK